MVKRQKMDWPLLMLFRPHQPFFFNSVDDEYDEEEDEEEKEVGIQQKFIEEEIQDNSVAVWKQVIGQYLFGSFGLKQVTSFHIKNTLPEDKKMKSMVKSTGTLRGINWEYSGRRSSRWNQSSADRVYEEGECSVRLCVICDNVISQNWHRSNQCGHYYCTSCFIEYVAEKIREGGGKVKCPKSKCKMVFGPDDLRRLVPKEVFDRWSMAILEAEVLFQPSFLQCPSKDCSAFL